nr:MAG TPA: Protein of unknown function (DUF1382) [Crassvirales sp.]
MNRISHPGILFFCVPITTEHWKHYPKMSKHGQPMRTAFR